MTGDAVVKELTKAVLKAGLRGHGAIRAYLEVGVLRELSITGTKVLKKIGRQVDRIVVTAQKEVRVGEELVGLVAQ